MRIPSMSEMREAGLKPQADINWISRGYRKFSLHVSRFAIGAGLSASTVTSISCVFALTSSFVLVSLSSLNLILSVVTLQLFLLLDHVDGEVARVERFRNPQRQNGIAGEYYDLLIHFFQVPSLYGCLGLGLSWVSGNQLWAIAGIVGAIGAGAFPMLVAQRIVLGWVARTRNVDQVSQVAQTVTRHALLESEVRERAYLIPRSFAELKWLLKQLFGGTTGIMLYSVLALADAASLAGPGYPVLKTYLIAMTSMRVMIVFSSTRKFLQTLGTIS